MFNIIFELLRPFHWFVAVGTIVLLGLMPLMENYKDKELNKILVFQIASYTFLSVVLLCVGSMFNEAPEMAAVFLQSIFISISEEERIRLQELHLSPLLLILNTFAIGGFSYSAFKSFELWTEHYSAFLARGTLARRRYLCRVFGKSSFGRNWRFHVLFILQFLLISLILHACGVAQGKI